MFTAFLATAGALALLLLPFIVLALALLLAGALVGTLVLALLPSMPSLAALLLIGWAIYKGSTRRSSTI